MFACAGVGELVLDILATLSSGSSLASSEEGETLSPSLLVLGRPGAGKTTLLRDIARLLSGRSVYTCDVSTFSYRCALRMVTARHQCNGLADVNGLWLSQL